MWQHNQDERTLESVHLFRVKHFISCSYRDLDFLATHLESITTKTYTAELVKKTKDRGDCCMLSIVEWGHARLEYEEDIGEFTFRVNETCLSSDHDIFMVAPTDRDAHNPILVHLYILLTWSVMRDVPIFLMR